MQIFTVQQHSPESSGRDHAYSAWDQAFHHFVDAKEAVEASIRAYLDENDMENETISVDWDEEADGRWIGVEDNSDEIWTIVIATIFMGK